MANKEWLAAALRIQSHVLNLISITQVKYEHARNSMSPRKLDAHVVL